MRVETRKARAEVLNESISFHEEIGPENFRKWVAPL
jgi:hypothetical protein